jgi:hypothetical protein
MLIHVFTLEIVGLSRKTAKPDVLAPYTTSSRRWRDANIMDFNACPRKYRKYPENKSLMCQQYFGQRVSIIRTNFE